MGIFNITGDDTITLFDRVFNDLADGDVSNIEFPNDLVTLKTGKNQNTIYAKNETGNNANITLRLMRGSSDDRFLNQLYAQMTQDFATFNLGNGQLSKRMGDGQGNVVFDIYNLGGVIFSKPVEVKSNAEGDTDQGVSVWTLKAAVGTRSNQ